MDHFFLKVKGILLNKFYRFTLMIENRILKTPETKKMRYKKLKNSEFCLFLKNKSFDCKIWKNKK